MSLSFEGSKERAGRRGNRFTIAPVGVSLERWRVEVEEEGEDKGEKWEAKVREEKRRSAPIQLLPARRSPPTKPAISLTSLPFQILHYLKTSQMSKVKTSKVRL